MEHSLDELQKVLNDVNTRLLDYAIGVLQLNPPESIILLNRRGILEKAIRDKKSQREANQELGGGNA